ncbi:hypothetical protein [Persephonella sp.]
MIFRAVPAVILLFILSCSPKYRIEKIYHPPTDRECVNKCQKEFEQCGNTCQKNYNDCLKESINKAKKIYSLIEKDYNLKLNKYYREYELYQKRLNDYKKEIQQLKDDYRFYEKICAKYKDKEACYKKEKIKKQIKYYQSNKPSPPVKPPEVSFENILKKEREICSCDCGCKEIYDACYQSCGGRVEIQRICVENCD